MRLQSSSQTLPPLIMGGAGFSYQLHPDPKSLPVLETVKRAFELGLRAIDTSPYYEPSEELLGAALSHPDIMTRYRRDEFVIMTKCGRIAAKHFDYSPAWVRKSVERSLHRFKTSYLDVVFCHDVEFVSSKEAVDAVGVLFDLSRTGSVKNVGISGYDLQTLLNIATEVRTKYGKSVDVVQSWAQLTLQNTRLEREGLNTFRNLGVKAVCNASPLAVGLLRTEGVPVGTLGDWHPASPGLRAAAQDAALWVQNTGDTLTSLALRYSIARGLLNSQPGFTVATITGIGSISDLHENVRTAQQILSRSQTKESTKARDEVNTLTDFMYLDQTAYDLDLPKYQAVRNILGPWTEQDFSAEPSRQSERPQMHTEVNQEGLTPTAIPSRL